MTLSCFDLTGKTALVTGGSKGLGKEIALALARAGADVAVASRTQKDLDEVAALIGAMGRVALPIAADMSDESSIHAVVERVVSQLGRLDILFNNAGIEGVGGVLDLDPELWDHTMEVNLRGPMLCCKHVGPHMIARRSGKIINVASVLATLPQRTMSPYAASKAGLVQFTRVLALEWIRHGIQVNALCPGYFLTPMNASFFATDAGQQFIDRLPSRRIAQPEEIDGAAVFLASSASDYVTGTSLYIDGGHSLR